MTKTTINGLSLFLTSFKILLFFLSCIWSNIQMLKVNKKLKQAYCNILFILYLKFYVARKQTKKFPVSFFYLCFFFFDAVMCSFRFVWNVVFAWLNIAENPATGMPMYFFKINVWLLRLLLLMSFNTAYSLWISLQWITRITRKCSKCTSWISLNYNYTIPWIIQSSTGTNIT